MKLIAEIVQFPTDQFLSWASKSNSMATLINHVEFVSPPTKYNFICEVFLSPFGVRNWKFLALLLMNRFNRIVKKCICVIFCLSKNLFLNHFKCILPLIFLNISKSKCSPGHQLSIHQSDRHMSEKKREYDKN